jgi:hypothetical protein
VTTNCELQGHETVKVPAGTFLAAKVLVGLSMTGTVTVDLGNRAVRGTIAVSDVQTIWGVPGVGAVQIKETLSMRIVLPGASPFANTANGTMKMTGHG